MEMETTMSFEEHFNSLTTTNMHKNTRLFDKLGNNSTSAISF